MQPNPTRKRPRLIFYFLSILVLSIPFWILGGSRLPLPIVLPVSALMFVNPLIAAAILTYWESGFHGVGDLLKRTFDFGKIKHPVWYIPALFLNPVIFFVSYLIIVLTGRALPNPIEIPLILIPVFFVIFFIAGAFEELGWMGYAVDPLQNRWGALAAGLILGVFWGFWHTIPYVQQGSALNWIIFQILNSVALRVLIVWIFNNSGGSVFAAILVHDTFNVSTYLFPNFGSAYDPFITSMLTSLAAIIVIVLWGPGTLARFRFHS
jgi:membrane protease YdiL (CAAX protease family)